MSTQLQAFAMVVIAVIGSYLSAAYLNGAYALIGFGVSVAVALLGHCIGCSDAFHEGLQAGAAEMETMMEERE